MFNPFKKKHNYISDNKQDYLTLLQKYAIEPIVLTGINLSAYNDGDKPVISTLHSLTNLFNDDEKCAKAIDLYNQFLDYVQENSKLNPIQKGEEEDETVSDTDTEESED